MVNLCFNKDEICGLSEGLEYAGRVRGFKLSENGVKVNVKKGKELRICGSGDAFNIEYESRTDFFRGVSMLTGLLEKNEGGCDISQKAAFDMCGIMIDSSRNAVLKPEKVIDIIARTALMGLNTVMLYTEDTYEVEGYEYFGYMRGRYTKEEIRKIDKAAHALGVELIPCIQTLAHLRAALRWGFADEIKDNEYILLADEDKTYELIDAMFKSLRDMYSSKKIHIGMDEAHGVCMGKYLEKHGYQNRFDVLSRHVSRVCEIAKKYGFEPMMWSDMFFRIASKTNDYYDMKAKVPDDLPAKIPENISMVYWDYYHTDKSEYAAMIKNHKDLKREVVFAGGIWTWSGMAPQYNQTFRTTIPALSVCRAENIKNVFATVWGDDGGEVSSYTMLLGMQLYAEYNYNKDVTMEKLWEAFELCTGMNADSFTALELDDIPESFIDGDYVQASKMILYQDILCGLFDKNIACFDFKAHYEKKYEKLKDIPNMGALEEIFEYYRCMAKFLSLKCDIGQKIRNAYEEKDKSALSKCLNDLSELREKLDKLRNAAFNYWYCVNKPFGFDIFDIRLGGIDARAQTAYKRIDSYCKGEIEGIEELDEKLLWYRSEKDEGKVPRTYFYNEIVSASSSGTL